MTRALPAPAPTAACPCGAGAYGRCCGPFHAGDAAPATAEQLMRSRYSAYVLHDTAYLRRTWHPSTCPTDLERSEADTPATRWLGLDVKRHAQQDPTHATVEFVARYKVGGRAHRLHETSRFVRLDASGAESPQGRWLYVDGDLT
ncbi:YchJ family metal-binding protein [Ralstonia pseudosolanacearum]|uniref:YchJ family metal-binding protein n=1 Tax=Ralstonia pseudosolanacearum TaxID=1310165 RepID=UPI003AACB212